MRACVLVLTVAACWSSPPAPVAPRTSLEAAHAPASGAAFKPSHRAPTHEQRCAKSLGTAFDVSREELASSGLDPDVVEEIEDAFVVSCEAMQWAEEVLECIGNVTNVADWNPCQNQMTQEQRDDSMKRAFEILQKRTAIPTSSRGTTPPP